MQSGGQGCDQHSLQPGVLGPPMALSLLWHLPSAPHHLSVQLVPSALAEQLCVYRVDRGREASGDPVQPHDSHFDTFDPYHDYGIGLPGGLCQTCFVDCTGLLWQSDHNLHVQVR